MKHAVTVTVNGRTSRHDVEPRLLLVHLLRDVLGLTGTHVGCETSLCGACTVLMDGLAVKSCSMLAVQADGAHITTIEGLADTWSERSARGEGRLHPLQSAFQQEHGLQCGFCTPGMIMTAAGLLADNPDPTEAEVRHALQGNLCRCTGYHNIVCAVLSAAAEMRTPAGALVPEREPAWPAGGDGGKTVGHPVRRTEDPRLITGTSLYTDDIRRPGMAYCVLVRSPHAHARIRSVDVSAALTAPGVIVAATGEDLVGAIAGLPVSHRIENLKTPPHRVLATDKVRYVGDGVAAVVAESPAAASDAAERVVVEYEELEAVVEVERAALGKPFVHEELGTNVAFEFPCAAGEFEDVWARAPVRIEQRIVNQRLVPVAIEPRSVVAEFERGRGKLTVWTTTQIPHLVRMLLAVVLDLPEHSIRVIAPEVGGGFGSKLNFYAEEALIAHFARTLGRPVKWTETRSENFLATTHGRDQRALVSVAAERDGRCIGLRVDVLQDLGAYHQLLTPVIPTMTAVMLPGCYGLKNLDVRLKGVFTNKTPTDAYRGAGRPEATYIIERVMDLIAAETGVDPVEVRRRNLIPREAFPYATCTGLTYDSGNYEGSLAKLLESADYEELRREQAERRARGEIMGIGLSTYVEVCGMGPSAAMSAGGWEACTVEVLRTGKVVVRTGVSPHGQGAETTFAQIAADGLGVAIGDVVVEHGDTDVVPQGIGTFGSRTQAVGGSALALAVQSVRDKARAIAAHLLGVDPNEVTAEGARWQVRGSPDRQVTFGEVVSAAFLARDLPPGMEPGLTATRIFDPPNFTFPFGAHLCVVDIDPETGEPTIRRYVAVDDCGFVVNPLIVDGQVHGGIAQAAGQALYEEAAYEEGGQFLTGSLMEYAVPRASHLPSFELHRTVTPTPVNPLGTKGVGEAGTIGATPCIMNAIVDALTPFGVRHLDMPARAEKILGALRSGS